MCPVLFPGLFFPLNVIDTSPCHFSQAYLAPCKDPYCFVKCGGVIFHSLPNDLPSPSGPYSQRPVFSTSASTVHCTPVKAGSLGARFGSEAAVADYKWPFSKGPPGTAYI